MTTAPQCLVCEVPLERGFVADHTYGEYRVARWCAGDPERSWLGGEARGSQVRQGLKISAWRCPSCGRVELFALPSPE